MKIPLCAVLALAMPALMSAQAAPSSNPVLDSARNITQARTRILVAAAQAMPEDKYGYKPTPEQNSFGHTVMHITESNYFLCSKIAGIEAPKMEMSETDSKDKLIQGMQGSFDFCQTNLAKVTDSQLGDPVTLFGGRASTKAGALFSLIGDFYDHYSAMAMYLRLNGILPPTAQRPGDKKGGEMKKGEEKKK